MTNDIIYELVVLLQLYTDDILNFNPQYFFTNTSVGF